MKEWVALKAIEKANKQITQLKQPMIGQIEILCHLKPILERESAMMNVVANAVQASTEHWALRARLLPDLEYGLKSSALGSAQMNLVQGAIASINSAIGDRVADVLGTLTFAQSTWAKQMLELPNQVLLASKLNLVSQINIERISQISNLAFEKMSMVSWGRLGVNMGIDEAVINGLQIKNSLLFNSFEQLENSIGSFSTELLPFGPSLIEMPSKELFNSANLLKVYSGFSIEHQDEEKEISDEIKQDVDERLPLLLEKINPDFLRMWDGSGLAIKNSNPDKDRHVMISLRELFRNILHTLAPDDKVKAFSNCSEVDRNGHPTRRCKLRYIYRRFYSCGLVDFAEADINEALEFISLANDGAKKIASFHTNEELNMARTRIGNLLIMMITQSYVFD